MSIDFDFVCHVCKAKIHAGQIMGGLPFSSGSGPTDVQGREEVGGFILRHEHDHNDLGFVVSDQAPPKYEDYVDESSP